MSEPGMRRYGGEHDGDKSVTPGRFEFHHTELCDIDFHSERVSPSGATRSFWCNTHGQWMSEIPVKLTYTWADGTTATFPQSR